MTNDQLSVTWRRGTASEDKENGKEEQKGEEEIPICAVIREWQWSRGVSSRNSTALKSDILSTR